MGLLTVAQAPAVRAEVSATDLSGLSIEELGDVEVTSVSKRAEPIGQAPSAIYVITAEAIARSGAPSIPEALRLAPNLQVAQAGASRYVITARGFNGAPAAQNFSNKLLVLIDGRSVYAPLYSGVYWDVQDVLMQDIERIEVISGPGATLWGANAVNGVINIITRRSGETQGALLSVAAGDQRRSASLRYGGKLSEALTYRVYAKTFSEEDTKAAAGGLERDHWSKPQAGFRLDWSPSSTDLVTLQGDAYRGEEARTGVTDEEVSGANLVARWARTWTDGSSLQVQAYFDRAERRDDVGGSGLLVDTYDFDLQHAFSLGRRHEIVWGGGYRQNRYTVDGTPVLQVDPTGGRLNLGNLFVQDSISLTPTTTLVLGAKLEDDPYVEPELLPNARLSWTPGQQVTLWGAVSRAIRSPTPFDRDVVERTGGVIFLVGGPTFQSETLTAYELGAKVEPSARLSLSFSAFYNDYDDLRSIEPTPQTFLPLYWGNLIRGRTYGLESWGAFQAASWWRLSAAVTYLEESFDFKPGAGRVVGLNQTANDPKYRASVTSSMNLGRRLSLDGTVRYQSDLPDPRLPSYTEMDARLGWAVTERVQLSLAGRNLLHEQHREYTDGAAIPRSVFLDLQWRF